MADVATESEGKAAGGRAVQRRLILLLSVLWECGIFCSVLVPTRKIVKIICPTQAHALAPIIQPKKTPLLRYVGGFTSTYDSTIYKELGCDFFERVGEKHRHKTVFGLCVSDCEG